MLNTLRIKCSVIFATNILLDNHSGYNNFQYIYVISPKMDCSEILDFINYDVN